MKKTRKNRSHKSVSQPPRKAFTSIERGVASKSDAVTIPMISGKGRQQQAEKQAARAAATAATKNSKPLHPSESAKRNRAGMSGLDAAAKVLASADKPLNAIETVKSMLDRGLWKSRGKTPHATIYAAIIREINKKGSTSRFRKTGRGHFTIAPHAKAVK